MSTFRDPIELNRQLRRPGGGVVCVGSDDWRKELNRMQIHLMDREIQKLRTKLACINRWREKIGLFPIEA